jgi:hypothetical protein
MKLAGLLAYNEAQRKKITPNLNRRKQHKHDRKRNEKA